MRIPRAAIGQHRPYHYADVFGADGKRVGRVRYGYNFRRPLESLLHEYRGALRAKRVSEPDTRDPFTHAVQQVRIRTAGHHAAAFDGAGQCIGWSRCVLWLLTGQRDIIPAAPLLPTLTVWPCARAQAAAAPASAKYMAVYIDRCEGLLTDGLPQQCRPYVHYR